MSEDLVPWWPEVHLDLSERWTSERGYFLGALVKLQPSQQFWACPGIALGSPDVSEADFQSEGIRVTQAQVRG